MKRKSSLIFLKKHFQINNFNTKSSKTKTKDKFEFLLEITSKRIYKLYPVKNIKKTCRLKFEYIFL